MISCCVKQKSDEHPLSSINANNDISNMANSVNYCYLLYEGNAWFNKNSAIEAFQLAFDRWFSSIMKHWLVWKSLGVIIFLAAFFRLWLCFPLSSTLAKVQKWSPIGVLLNSCSAALYKIHRRTPMRKCDFNKVDMQNIIFVEHLWGTSSECCFLWN